MINRIRAVFFTVTSPVWFVPFVIWLGFYLVYVSFLELVEGNQNEIKRT